MKYQTTNLQPTKRYPTYQFHARTAQKKLPAEQVFCICVLETMHWLRSRLKKFSSLPEDICTPEPAQYEAFSMQQLHSFHSSVGAAVDVIYLENRGLWSFQITEPDIGANLGTPQERPAVSGRIFETEISFLLCKDDVEVGVRTICSEPSDSTAPCEVFRPMIIPALAQNPHVGFLKNGFLLNGKAMEIRKKSDIAYFDALCHAADFDMPLVVVADSGTVQKKLDLEQLDVSAVPKLQPFSAELSAHNDMLHFYDRNVQMNEAESTVTKNLQQPLNRRVKRHVSSKMKLKPEAASPAKVETTEKLPVFPFEKLAEKLLGFGVVCFVEHRCLEEFSRKYKLALQEGDMLILRHGSTAERYPYAQYARDMDGFSRQRKQELRQMLKRGAFTFGRILFHSDARLAVLQDSQQETLSLEERCRILQQENDELKNQLKDFTQQNTDMRMNGEQLRIYQKQLAEKEAELERRNAAYQVLEQEYDSKKNSYQQSTEIVQFYREKADIAATFPTDKEAIPEWAEKHFSDSLIFTQRARNSLRKFSSKLDLAVICDGILYLSAYGKFRQGNLSEELLELYGQRYCWDVSRCGAETLRVHREDYLAQVDDRKYLLDMHIKYGIKAKGLARLYFCWNEELQKIVLGYLPSHLPTLKNPT